MLLQNQYDLDQLRKERTKNDLLDLYTEFSTYENYSERLEFWDNCHLGLQLWYSIGKGVFLSILPVNYSDIELFTEWALTFRVKLRDHIEEYPSDKRPGLRITSGCLSEDSFKVKELEFWQQLSSSPDRVSFLERTFNELSNPKGSTVNRYHTLLAGDDNGALYQDAERELLKGKSVKEILLYHFKSIPMTQWERFWNVWEAIDKVLNLETNLHFNGFLRDLKLRHDKREPIVMPSESRVDETQSKPNGITAAQFLFIEHFDIGTIHNNPYKDKKEHYNNLALKYGKTSEDYKKAFKRVEKIIDQPQKITSGQIQSIKEDLKVVINYFEQKHRTDIIKRVKDFSQERSVYLKE